MITKSMIIAQRGSIAMVDHASHISEFLTSTEIPLHIGKWSGTVDVRALQDTAEKISDDLEKRDLSKKSLRAILGAASFVRSAETKGISSRNPRSELLSAVPSLLPAEREATAWFTPGAIPGVCIVLGETSSGKTTFLKKESKVQFVIRVSEPLEEIDYDDSTIAVSSFGEALEVALILSVLGLRVAIDGARKLVYELGGTTMTGGISSLLFTVATDINNLAAMLGTSFMISVNPMTDDDVAAQSLATKLSSAVSGVIFIAQKDWQWLSARRHSSAGGRVTISRPGSPFVKEGSVLPNSGPLSGSADRSFNPSIDQINVPASDAEDVRIRGRQHPDAADATIDDVEHKLGELQVRTTPKFNL